MDLMPWGMENDIWYSSTKEKKRKEKDWMGGMVGTLWMLMKKSATTKTEVRLCYPMNSTVPYLRTALPLRQRSWFDL